MSLRSRFSFPRAFLSQVASSGWWQGALVLAPLVLLAGLGLRGLQTSREAAFEAARRRSQQALQVLARDWQSLLESQIVRWKVPKLFPDPPAPSAPNEALELFHAATAVAPDEAPGLLTRLVSEHPDAVAESGVPLLPLVLLAQLRHVTDPGESEHIAIKLAEAAVKTHPSILTPDLLEAGDRLLTEKNTGAGPFIYWKSQWDQDERARAVLRHLEVSGAGAAAAAVAWVRDHSGELWWRGNGEILVSHKHLAELAVEPLTPRDEELSRSISVVAALDGVPLGETNRSGEEMARLTDGPLTLTAHLTDPAALYSEQSRQTAWLSALLASALLAVLAGFWLMRRSLTRERQLGELKSNFVASVSHELRAPIASMRVMAENLESGVVHEEPRRGEYHRLISEECRRLATLIDNVLDFARIEQKRKAYHFGETDVPALTRDAIKLVEPRAAQRQQTISAELEAVEPPPVCDGAAVQQALINLLDNAIKFSPEEAAIAVRLRSAGNGTWELSVKDSGPGIPPAEHRRIFERFYRLGSELCRETQGAGIGLSIVQHIAEGHGGRVEVESDLGHGATFTLVLPFLPARAREEL